MMLTDVLYRILQLLRELLLPAGLIEFGHINNCHVRPIDCVVLASDSGIQRWTTSYAQKLSQQDVCMVAR